MQIPGNTLTSSGTPPDVEYTPYNNVPMGATHHKGRLFVTMPRRRTGIPSTLNYIDMKSAAGNRSPRLRAYPNLEVNTLNVSVTFIILGRLCNRFVSGICRWEDKNKKLIMGIYLNLFNKFP